MQRKITVTEVIVWFKKQNQVKSYVIHIGTKMCLCAFVTLDDTLPISQSSKKMAYIVELVAANQCRVGQ